MALYLRINTYCDPYKILLIGKLNSLEAFQIYLIQFITQKDANFGEDRIMKLLQRWWTKWHICG